MENAPNYTLREPQRISNVQELENAKKKAHINATQDKLRIASSLNELKSEGPSVILKTLVLPAVGIGVALFGVSKLVESFGSSKRHRHDTAHFTSYPNGAPAANYSQQQAPPPSYAPPKESLVKRASIYLPIALKLAKMGVSYMEKNGKPVPQLVHDLLAGPGNSSEQKS